MSENKNVQGGTLFNKYMTDIYVGNLSQWSHPCIYSLCSEGYSLVGRYTDGRRFCKIQKFCMGEAL